MMSGSDAFEPVVGEPMVCFRIWRVEPDPSIGSFALRSIHYGVFWPGSRDPLKATCQQGVYGNSKESDPSRMYHRAPEPAHNCGIYAVMGIAECEVWAREAGLSEGKPIAFGEVDLWGRIFQHERGVRAECARPRWIRVLESYGLLDLREILSNLEQVYGVPAHAARAPW